MNSNLIALVALNPIQDVETAAPPRALDRVAGISDLLQFFEHKTRNNQDSFDEVCFEQISDAAINDHARIEQQQVIGFVLLGKTDVRNDQRKILFVASHGEDDSDIAETQKERQADEPTRRISTGVIKQA